MAKKGKTQKQTVRIEVRQSAVHGRGVYAMQFIPKGTRVIEYTGERTSWEAAPNDENDPHTFNFGLDNGQVINPEIGGNDARWINHSCDPNCEAAEEEDRIFAISSPERNSFTITRWKSTSRSRKNQKRNTLATAAAQSAAAQCSTLLRD
jgi:hypothetical protein